jgi:hypothetical protein
MGKGRMFYLTEKDFERLDYLCNQTGFTASTVTRLALQSYFDDFRRKEWKVDREMLNSRLPTLRKKKTKRRKKMV